MEFDRSTKMRGGIALAVLVLLLGAGGLAVRYRAAPPADSEQLNALDALTDSAAVTLRGGFEALAVDIGNLASRLGSHEAPAIDYETSEGEVADEREESEEEKVARWRESVENGFLDLAQSRMAYLDITYLGRFAGVRNGGLEIVRVERGVDDSLNVSNVDPRPGLPPDFLQAVIQNEVEGALFSAPTFIENGDEAIYPVMRGASKVLNGDGAVIGLVLVSLDLTPLLQAVGRSLSSGTSALLVADSGEVLLHPVHDLNYSKLEDGTGAIEAQYPTLVSRFNNQSNDRAFSVEISGEVLRLQRIVVEGGGQSRSFSLVIAQVSEHPQRSYAEIARGWLPSDARQLRELAAGGALIALLFALFVWRRSLARAPHVVSEKTDTGLAKRANKIAREEGDDVGAGASGMAAAAEDDCADDYADDDSPDDDAVDESGNGEEFEDAEQTDDEPDSEESVLEDSENEGEADEIREPADAEEPLAAAESQKPVAEERLRSAHDLATVRNRLEAELEEARQRSLRELAAARVRFESELAFEREKAIAQIVKDAREEEFGGDVLHSESRSQETFSPEPGEFDLRQLLAEVSAWMDAESRGREVGLEIRCNRSVPNRLIGDPDWIGPMLINLSRSAMRYSERGPVELSVSCADAGAGAVQLCVALHAEDTGLESNDRGAVRERYPAGLRLTEEILETMQGEIRVDNADSEGSTVRLYLPMSLPR